MSSATFTRIVRNRFIGGSLKERYWAVRKSVALSARLLWPANCTFALHVLRNHLRVLFGMVRPVNGQTRARAQAAAAWLLRAQDATRHGGVSYGYFAAEVVNGSCWRLPDPEITAHTIPSVVDFSDAFHDETVR